MESGVVRRRANIIAGHLASHEDLFATAAHLFPMSCSNSLNTIARRYDNRINFARQGSSSQGPFMRPSSEKQGIYEQTSTTTIYGEKESNVFGTPMFSRPSQVKPGISDSKYVNPAPDAPTFARPSQIYGNQSQETTTKLEIDATDCAWSPRMDIAESRYHYFITLEIPGVSIDNLNVEVQDRSLIVTGNRSSGVTGLNKSVSSYHKKEISERPYRIVWPIPSNANRENVSAEIQEGLLRITVPKVSGLKWLMKAHM